MDVYKNWKWSVGEKLSESTAKVDILCGSISWYDLMDAIDELEDRWVVCVGPDGYIAWYTDSKVSGQYAPSDGHTVIVTDSIPFEGHGLAVRGYLWNGSSFIENKEEVAKERTKEDILADLIRLQEELKAL